MPRSTLILAFVVLIARAVPGMAQAAISSDSLRQQTQTPDSVAHAQDASIQPFGPSLHHLLLTTVISTGILLPLDASIERQVHRARGAGHGPLEPVASTLNWIGDPGTVIAPVVLATAGWLSHRQGLTTLGVRTMESVVFSGGVTALIKGTAGRTRPSPSSLDADDFVFSKGFGGKATSFPSGHTTAAFAMATSLTAETHRMYPGATWLVGVTSYSVATGVAFARVYTNHHWTSDVALGAGIGTLSALFIDRVVHSGLPRHGLLALLH